MIVYLIVFRTASNLHLVAVFWFFILTIPVMLFLMAVLCYLVYEESWRVDGKICDSFGPVQMETCDEGETSNGYRGLSGFVIAVSVCVTVAIALLSLKLKQGVGILHQVAKVHRKSLVMHGCAVFILVTGVVFYAYFITLLIYQVSSGDNSWKTEPSLLQGQVNTWSFNDADLVAGDEHCEAVGCGRIFAQAAHKDIILPGRLKRHGEIIFLAVIDHLDTRRF